MTDTTTVFAATPIATKSVAPIGARQQDVADHQRQNVWGHPNVARPACPFGNGTSVAESRRTGKG
jgi:hypothetical protein